MGSFSIFVGYFLTILPKSVVIVSFLCCITISFDGSPSCCGLDPLVLCLAYIFNTCQHLQGACVFVLCYIRNGWGCHGSMRLRMASASLIWVFRPCCGLLWLCVANH